MLFAPVGNGAGAKPDSKGGSSGSKGSRGCGSSHRGIDGAGGRLDGGGNRGSLDSCCHSDSSFDLDLGQPLPPPNLVLDSKTRDFSHHAECRKKPHLRFK